ncbi:MAG: hypothetical protein ACOYJQ_00375 [Pseudochelatococcus sp.]|jgi:hypothetical protein|uniref:hypothetical protein n=1 Tax=Pseudochelatococcus sp. TaxID=2020869 RepID=UPI003D8DCF71
MTTQLSGNALHAINDFAARAGISATPAQDGTFVFRFERSGDLTFMPALDGKRLIVSLLRTPAYEDPARELKALRAAGADLATGLFLHAALTTHGAIVFSFALEENEIDPPRIERCVDRLIDVHNRLG